ncbi:MAG: hypothetical protein MZU91_01705 [Desulfosudis oleivorans]|nr:hypothetical protein [Desulfosudis oleivorans]
MALDSVLHQHHHRKRPLRQGVRGEMDCTGFDKLSEHVAPFTPQLLRRDHLDPG